MEQKKHVGPKAGALKYDLLTALTVMGLHGTPTEQTSLMRLTALITARYNWRLEEVSVGHLELSRLWAVNERTVKREMKRLMNMGVMICIRPGVRGRVGAYRLNYRQIYAASRESWSAVGPDFEDRMIDVSGEKTVVRVDFTKPDLKAVQLVSENTGGSWGAVRRRLKQAHPEVFENWFAKLVQDKCDDDSLVLRAPSGFVSGYIETHFADILADAIHSEMPTPTGKTRQVTLIG